VQINVKNVGFDFYESPHNLIGVNAIDATIAYHKLKFPLVSAHQSELLKSDKAKILLKTPLMQFVHVPKKGCKISEKSIKDTITENYKNIIDTHPEFITDFYYQYYPNYLPNDKERDAILDIQRDSGAFILSDYETNPAQSIDQFELQILDLRNNNSKYLPSPTLDIGMQPIGLFAKKIDKLIEHKFQRFNVIYRSIFTRQVNWIELSQKIFEKDIWCNVVGVPQRYISQTNPFSLLSTVLLYGAHSASLGYPIIRNTKKTQKSKYNFNKTTHGFDKVSDMSESESRTISINDQIDELTVAREHIIKRTFFSEYVQTKTGLLEALKMIP
jgi:hypothetical protein